MTTPPDPRPKPIDWQNLIHAGRDFLNPQTTGSATTDEHIRRAISNAYYALFHALAGANADVLIGAPRDAPSTAAWSRVYRGLDHRTASRDLQRHRSEFSAALRIFADTFYNLQQLRHSADYDHNAAFTSHEARVWLAEAEVAIIDYLQVHRGELAYIATLTLIRGR